MNQPKTYSGAFSRRRYSNMSTTGKVTTSSASSTYRLAVSSANPAMGSVEIDTSAVVASSGLGTANGGTVTPNRDGSFSFPAGAKVSVKAKHNAGYRFAGWQGVTANAQSNPIVVTMTRDVTLKANFEPVTTAYNLRVNYDSSMGRVNANGLQDGVMSVAAGAQVTLEAVPKDGYRFEGWSGLASKTTSRNITVTMPSHDLTLAALFSKVVDNPGGGGGTPGGGTDDTPENPGGGGGGGSYTPETISPLGSNSLIDQAIAFAKKYWWALAIVAYLIYDRKGGRK